jgi:hypothetical protein
MPKIQLLCCFLTGLMLQCLAADIPFPAYETFRNKKELGRRSFLFYDLFFQAGRHNKEAWKEATYNQKGENNKRFGTALLEAHVQTTIQENYFRWIYQGLTDRKIIQNDDDAFQFQTEYDADDNFSDNTCTLNLPDNCEIVYNEEENIFDIIQEEEDPEGFKTAQEDQMEIIKKAVEESRNRHQEVIQLLKREVRRMRKNPDKIDEDTLKLCHSKNKKILKQLVDNENEMGGTRKNKRKRSNKSRCSDMKISFLSEMKNIIDDDEKSGVRKSWEAAYKKVMNDSTKKDDDAEEDRANEIRSSVWVNELGSINIEEL